jgi:hypothetical protein
MLTCVIIVIVVQEIAQLSRCYYEHYLSRAIYIYIYIYIYMPYIYHISIYLCSCYYVISRINKACLSQAVLR